MSIMRYLRSLTVLFLLPLALYGQDKNSSSRHEWRTATPAELQAVLPARAPVDKERIETEMRSATGVINTRGQVIAAVVLITAGYAANGKYSYYLLTQTPLRLGPGIALPAGTYAVGWTRAADGLQVHVYEAETGVERGTAIAHPLSPPLSVVSVKLWPPSDRSILQIGRFALPYTVGE